LLDRKKIGLHDFGGAIAARKEIKTFY